MKNKFLPSIDEYLRNIDDNCPVTLENLNELVDSVISKSPLNDETTKVICRLFFQEIRNALLNGERINLEGFGKFFAVGPGITGGRRTQIYFRPNKKMLKDLDD